jgi:hypothetical protein
MLLGEEAAASPGRCRCSILLESVDVFRRGRKFEGTPSYFCSYFSKTAVEIDEGKIYMEKLAVVAGARRGFDKYCLACRFSYRNASG